MYKGGLNLSKTYIGDGFYLPFSSRGSGAGVAYMQGYINNTNANIVACEEGFRRSICAGILLAESRKKI